MAARGSVLAIEYWPVDRPKPNARNARTHSDAQLAQIEASIREFGFTTPLLCDPDDDDLIAGHGRLRAARERLGLAEVPIIPLRGLTPAQKRALRLADNKLALNAGWDYDLLQVELADIGTLGLDLSLTGFSPAELKDLLPGASGDDGGDGKGGGDGTQEQFSVILVCKDKAHQRETVERLVELGYEPKVETRSE